MPWVVIAILIIIIISIIIIFLMANLIQVPSSNNSEFHIIRRSMREQKRLFRRQNGIIYSPFTSSRFLKPRFNLSQRIFLLFFCGLVGTSTIITSFTSAL